MLDQILVMLHPFMPFVTEELWSKLGERPYELIVAKWPEPRAGVDAQAKREVEWLISLISDIRSNRTQLNIPPGTRLEGVLIPTDQKSGSRLSRNTETISRMGRVNTDVGPVLDEDELRAWVVKELGASIQITNVDGVLALKLEGVIDIAAEKTRLEKALTVSQKEAKSLEGRLANPAFVEKAKPEAVAKAREDHAAHAAEAERLAAALGRLG